MSRVLHSLVLIVVVLSALTIATPAQAATVEECQAAIANLHTATVAADFTGQNAAKDEAGLLARLESASDKLGQGKVADSLQALSQFQAKVVSLDEQGKIAPEDAQTLLAGAGGAISCVGTLTA